MSVATMAADPTDRLATLEAETRRELDQTREQLTEIQLLLQQSENEADKLAQREGAITSRVRDMEINLENYTRADVKTLYTSAHEVGLRLFMMRSQVEQLQMRQEHIKERQSQLGLVLSLVRQAAGAPTQATAPVDQAAQAVKAMRATASLRTIVEARESERLQVSRYLHDGPAQTLTNLVLRAEICEHLIDRDPAEAKAELRGLRSNLTNSLQDARRLIFDLRPMILDDIGVIATLRRYLSEVGRTNGFSQSVRGLEGGDELSPATRTLIFRLVQEIVSSLMSRERLENVSVVLELNGADLEVALDVRGANEFPPIDDVLALESVMQRLEMLSATATSSLIGERGVQLVVVADLASDA